MCVKCLHVTHFHCIIMQIEVWHLWLYCDVVVLHCVLFSQDAATSGAVTFPLLFWLCTPALWTSNDTSTEVKVQTVSFHFAPF